MWTRTHCRMIDEGHWFVVDSPFGFAGPQPGLLFDRLVLTDTFSLSPHSLVLFLWNLLQRRRSILDPVPSLTVSIQLPLALWFPLRFCLSVSCLFHIFSFLPLLPLGRSFVHNSLTDLDEICLAQVFFQRSDVFLGHSLSLCSLYWLIPHTPANPAVLHIPGSRIKSVSAVAVRVS